MMKIIQQVFVKRWKPILEEKRRGQVLKYNMFY